MQGLPIEDLEMPTHLPPTCFLQFSQYGITVRAEDYLIEYSLHRQHFLQFDQCYSIARMFGLKEWLLDH